MGKSSNRFEISENMWKRTNVRAKREIKRSESKESVCVRVCGVWEVVFDDVGASKASIAAQSAESELCVQSMRGKEDV